MHPANSQPVDWWLLVATWTWVIILCLSVVVYNTFYASANSIMFSGCLFIVRLFFCSTPISHDAISLYLVEGFQWNLSQIFLFCVGIVEKVFKVRGHRSWWSIPESLTCFGGGIHFGGVMWTLRAISHWREYSTRVLARKSPRVLASRPVYHDVQI